MLAKVHFAFTVLLFVRISDDQNIFFYSGQSLKGEKQHFKQNVHFW